VTESKRVSVYVVREFCLRLKGNLVIVILFIYLFDRRFLNENN